MYSYSVFSDRKLVELASYDDADSYEVDEGGIYFDKDAKKFLFISASGCSCWDGEYMVSDEYESLGDLAKALLDGDENGNDVFDWQPSLKRGMEMVEQAKVAINQGKLKEPIIPSINGLDDVLEAVKEIREKSSDFEGYQKAIDELALRLEKAISG